MSFSPLPFRLESLPATTLWALRTTHNLLNMQNASLWMAFRSGLGSTPLPAPEAWFSVSFYPADYFSAFSPAKSYDLACGIGAMNGEAMPSFAQEVEIPAGDYAVFTYQGLPGAAPFEWILRSWLPASGFQLDHRPHFERMPADYSPHNPQATEEIWVPVKK
ncbi:MAG: hypothetical protein C0424_12530 [Sphingobacteriaceae bacterium]|nr:hypothetical protein [Sphingobacteriaceae bacterium]